MLPPDLRCLASELGYFYVWPRVNEFAIPATVLTATSAGLEVKSPWGRRFTVAYGEILTAERLRRMSGVRLHTLGFRPVRIRVRGQAVLELEAVLRGRGVRVVDCWGAMITPTLSDFERALAEGPGPVRQLSDNA
jgi:hypothetical protein